MPTARKEGAAHRFHSLPPGSEETARPGDIRSPRRSRAHRRRSFFAWAFPAPRRQRDSLSFVRPFASLGHAALAFALGSTGALPLASAAIASFEIDLIRTRYRDV